MGVKWKRIPKGGNHVRDVVLLSKGKSKCAWDSHLIKHGGFDRYRGDEYG